MSVVVVNILCINSFIPHDNTMRYGYGYFQLIAEETDARKFKLAQVIQLTNAKASNKPGHSGSKAVLSALRNKM